MIVVRTLGPLEITVNGEPAAPELLWRKNLAVLVYLARSPKRVRTREHLAGLLWPDKPEPQARHSLNEALRVIRRVAGESAVETRGGQIGLADGAVALDVDELERLAAAGDWSAAAAIAGGEFLEGFGVPGVTDFEDWLAAERNAWRARAVEVLLRQQQALLDAGKLAEAVELAARAEAVDPFANSAVRATMRCLALAGDRPGALARYDAFAARLHRALGIAPDQSTEALAARVRQERTWQRHTPIPGREPGEPPRRAPLVGRAAELAVMLEAWAGCVRERRPAVGIVAGDPGMGRSRLVEELLGRVRLDGGAAALARGVIADRHEPWSTTLALGRTLLGAPGAAAADPTALAAFVTRLPDLGDRFPALRGDPQPLARAFQEIVRAVADEQPLVVALDDADLADGETLEALDALVRDLHGASVLILLTVTPAADRAALDVLRARLGREIAGVAVALHPLSDTELRELAEWALRGWSDEALDRVTRRVAADSAGLPLLAVEILHAVAAGLALGEPERTWPEPARTLDATLPSELPDAVVAAIRTGFRRLSADAQLVLAATAVLGGRATAATLARATAVSENRIFAALDELEWQRWLTSDERGYAFVARIVADVVAQDMVTPGQRRRIADAGGDTG